MIISVSHKINNPGSFWASAQENLPKLPEAGVTRVLQALPNGDMTVATCLWEAESIEKLDAYLRDKVKDWSEDTYHEVNTANAIGCPA
ncbi:MAG: hypothetical protein K0Q79_794 [Flavipsychrobacter sp.]|jgi:hypothetical protein|nr:hypothetical protein [Flavipsychrobacter sp.]